ncbi:MAG: hypothetical protein HZB37_09045 [Planctomycetes bacterium]|nr:hypothetical protein [Planctomycetota bacterium]
MSFWEFPRYVSVGEKQQRSKKKLEKLMKENKDIKPVRIEGTAIAKTWWGKAWNKNLEAYADYSNRIGRGRTYVRSGSVLDLQIQEGHVKALVQGSESDPYSIVIKIKSLEKDIWEEIKGFCAGKLDSLQKLLMGKFPEDLGKMFTARGEGLFPSPKEIDFDCSCPDIASMCKHVAATLYGIGARLDREPNLFFLLRQIEIGDLISETIRDKTEELLTLAQKKSQRILEGQDLSSVFGIEMDMVPGFENKNEVNAANKAASQDKVKPAAKTRKATAKKPLHEPRKPVIKKPAKKTKKVAKVKVVKGKSAKKPVKKLPKA